MPTYETPDQEIAALRALVANIRALGSWHYEDLDYLNTDSVRDLIDDEADDDQSIWVLGNDDGQVWSLADPSESTAVAMAAADADDDLRPMTRAEAKALGAAATIRRAEEQEQATIARAAAQAAAEEKRKADEVYELANPRYIDGFDFSKD